jgi:hypothetical protein
MKKAISVMQKRGRPPTGKTPTIALRATDEFRDTVERWAAKQSDKPSLSEAIRRLVEIGLKANTSEPKAVGRLRKRVAGAAELAAKAVDILTVGAADAHEKTSRKRRLKAKG